MHAWHDDELDAFDAPDEDSLYHVDSFGDGVAADGFDDFELRGDSGSIDTDAGDLTTRLDVLATGATGVAFEALAGFARPLFERYGVSFSEATALSETDADESTLSLLETARLLWAYFSLDEGDRDAHRSALLGHCYGPDADVEAWEDFADLLDGMGAAWERLTPAERADAEDVGVPTLSFDALLAGQDGADEAMHECDARALFALPLLDDPAVQANPDRFEAALHRADAYWTLAQRADRDDRLAALLPTLSASNAEVPALRTEAEQMLTRYDELFS